MDKFTGRGVRVVAVSVDPPEVTREHAVKKGYTFTLLADTKAEVIRKYDLLHAGGGIRSTDIARPAEFLIDPTGTIRWVNLTDDYRSRANAEQFLNVIDKLAPASTPLL
ncbi:MAG: peroxiredoxin family protein [Acidobacteria bacterium]|nr:peroxiredoxin family protein [Acidobacteriota bacterium]